MTTTGSGTGDFFEYQGVQTCQINIDNKFSEMAELLKSVNDYMNFHIHCPETEECALRGELGKRFLDDWNMNASTFSDFYENFHSWSLLMGDIIRQYGTFDLDAVKDAIESNQSTGATLKGVAETRAAQQFNEDQWRAEQTQLEMIGDSCDPTYMASLGWKEALVRNGTSASASGTPVQETEDKIARGETVYDQDGYGVNGLKLRPELCDDQYYNEFMIYEGIDHNGNKQYYSIDLDGGLHRVDPEHVSDIGYVKDNVKVGDTYSIIADGSGDNAADRIYKSSYIMGYDAASNQTYMALPRSDGTCEYYTVKGEIHGWDHESGTNWTGEVTQVGLTAEQVQNAGFNPLYVKQDYSARNDLDAVKEQYSGVEGVQGTGQAVDNGSYRDGQYYGTVTGGGVPAEEEEKQGTTPTPYTGTGPYVTTLEHDEDDEHRVYTV